VNNKELNKLMAEVMGWHKSEYVRGYSDMWLNDKNKTTYYCRDWNPTEDIAQAMMCADKMESVAILKYINPSEYYIHVTMGDVRYTRTPKTLDGISESICEAIAEAMEGEDGIIS